VAFGPGVHDLVGNDQQGGHDGRQQQGGGATGTVETGGQALDGLATACSARATPGCWLGYSVWTKLVMVNSLFKQKRLWRNCRAQMNTRVHPDIYPI
jgi:hypothetical protein